MYKLFLVRYTLLYRQTPKTTLKTSKTKQCIYTFNKSNNDNPPIFLLPKKKGYQSAIHKSSAPYIFSDIAYSTPEKKKARDGKPDTKRR